MEGSSGSLCSRSFAVRGQEVEETGWEKNQVQAVERVSGWLLWNGVNYESGDVHWCVCLCGP